MSVKNGFTLVEMLISLLITSLLVVMIADLSGASLSVFANSYVVESHISDFNALLFTMRQEASKAQLEEEGSTQRLYIEANKEGVANSCLRFVYYEDGELKQGGFRLDSDVHNIERYSPHGDNWSCNAGYWQDLHNSRFQVETLQFSYQEPILLLQLDAVDKSMNREENFYVSAYIKK